MTTPHAPIVVSPFQQKLKQVCIDVETLFECRLARAPFAVRIVLAAALILGAWTAQAIWLADARWFVHVLLWLVLGWASFWGILQIVRRFHDIGSSGGLFWALAVPFWALNKMIGYFPDLWIVWVLLCAWPIWMALQLFIKPGTEGRNRYDGRQPPAG